MNPAAPPASPKDSALSVFQGNCYTIRRKVLTLVGASFHIFNERGELVLFSRQKGFKLKEDLRLYADEAQTTELISIKARNVIDFSATYDVIDSALGETVGSLQRKGLSGLVRDEWLVNDSAGNCIGRIREDNLGLALVRRFLSNLVPQKFLCEINGQHAATFSQHFNPIVQKMNVAFEGDGDQLDPRLGLAAAVTIMAIEGRQS